MHFCPILKQKYVYLCASKHIESRQIQYNSNSAWNKLGHFVFSFWLTYFRSSSTATSTLTWRTSTWSFLPWPSTLWNTSSEQKKKWTRKIRTGQLLRTMEWPWVRKYFQTGFEHIFMCRFLLLMYYNSLFCIVLRTTANKTARKLVLCGLNVGLFSDHLLCSIFLLTQVSLLTIWIYHDTIFVVSSLLLITPHKKAGKHSSWVHFFAGYTLLVVG